MILTERDVTKEFTLGVRDVEGRTIPTECTQGIGREVLTVTELTWLNGTPVIFIILEGVDVGGGVLHSNRPTGNVSETDHTETLSYRHDDPRTRSGVSVFRPVTHDGLLDLRRGEDVVTVQFEFVRRMGSVGVRTDSEASQIAA
jgi:hypothetical protein